MACKYISNYKADKYLRNSFNNLAKDVFGIDFEPWFANGFWDDTYICHSLIQHGQVVSNVSTTKAGMIIDGVPKNALQIGTVMTAPAYRNTGLARQLMETVLDECEREVDLIYLFPNETVMDFYPKFGFTRMADYRYSMDIKELHPQKAEWRKIDTANQADLKLLQHIAMQRLKRSDRFDIRNSAAIFMWHCMNTFFDNIHIDIHEDTVIIFQENHKGIELYDVASRHPVFLRDLLGRLTHKDRIEVTFHFTPGFEDTDIAEMVEAKNEDMFIKPAMALMGSRFSHPLLAQT